MNTKKLTLTAVLFALALALSVFEGVLPPIAIPIPGIKIGLSNIVTMFALISVGASSALTIATLKGIFAAATRGLTAGLLSLSGGLLSVFAMLILLKVTRKSASCIALGVTGAVAHNIGQIAAFIFIYRLFGGIFYLPMLIFSGVAVGILTGILLKITLPHLNKIYQKEDTK